jgi:RNA polymerase sigma-70 factor (ECF subfamily)
MNGGHLDRHDLGSALIPLLADLRAYARFLAAQRAEADDLVQEALVRALVALPQFRDGSNLRAWLFTILRNAFFEQARRRRTERALLARSPAHDDASMPEQDARTDLADLQHHLFALPPLLRDALVLVGAQGISYEEASQICGVPVGTVKARVSRARTHLARMMQSQAAAVADECAEIDAA